MSRNRDRSPNSLSDGKAKALQRYPDYGKQLPPAEETWRAKEIDLPSPVLVKFDRAGIIRKVERERAENTDRWIWQTAGGVRDWLDEHMTPESTAPCGATGIRNLGDGQFTCNDPDCEDCEFGRETAKEVLSA